MTLIYEALEIIKTEMAATLPLPSDLADLGTRTIELRPLRPTDPNGSIGLYVANWAADMNSMLIGQYEPQLGSTTIQIQNLIKHGEEVAGQELFYQEAKMIRVMLYRSNPLRVSLGGLEELVAGTHERVKKYNITRQVFTPGQLGGVFMFFATTDLVIETETTA